MFMMTFSQFAQALFPYCNEGDSKPEYVKHLVDKIMDGQPGRPHDDGGYQNPMREKDERTLLNYFNGERSISPKDASRIYSSIKTEKFEKYIDSHCSAEAQIELLDSLLEIDDIEEKGMVPEVCAKIFKKILRDLADPKNPAGPKKLTTP